VFLLQTRGPKSPYHAAVAEQQAILKKHGSSVNFDVLGEMETLHLNIQEALRMHPPLLLVMRYVKQPFSVTTSQGKTYNIPVVRTRARLLASRCH
jgi:sterol 14-demethylase